MKITRLTVLASDECGSTTEKAYLVGSRAQATKIKAAVKLLDFTLQDPKEIAPTERLFSGRSSYDGDYCFELLTMAEMAQFLRGEGIVALTAGNSYEFCGDRSSANIKCVGTAAEVMAQRRAGI